MFQFYFRDSAFKTFCCNSNKITKINFTLYETKEKLYEFYIQSQVKMKQYFPVVFVSRVQGKI